MIKALLTGAAAFSLAAAPVFADSVRTTSGSTAIQLNMEALTPILNDATIKATITPVGGAKLGKTGILTLPIMGGAIDLTDADGEIIHSGGFKVSRYAGTSLRTVVFTNLALEVKVSEPVTPPVPPTVTIQITAIASVNGTLPTQPSFEVRPPAQIPAPITLHRIALFTLTNPPASLALNKAKKLIINGGALTLATPATDFLNSGLGLVTVPPADPLPTPIPPNVAFGKTSLFQAATKKL